MGRVGWSVGGEWRVVGGGEGGGEGSEGWGLHKNFKYYIGRAILLLFLHCVGRVCAGKGVCGEGVCGGKGVWEGV